MRWLKGGEQKPKSGSSIDVPNLERELGVRIGERGNAVLSLACVEMDRSNHRELGAEHLIVGVLEEGGPAAQLLIEHGMTLDEARAQIAEALWEAGDSAGDSRAHLGGVEHPRHRRRSGRHARTAGDRARAHDLRVCLLGLRDHEPGAAHGRRRPAQAPAGLRAPALERALSLSRHWPAAPVARARPVARNRRPEALRRDDSCAAGH